MDARSANACSTAVPWPSTTNPVRQSGSRERPHASSSRVLPPVKPACTRSREWSPNPKRAFMLWRARQQMQVRSATPHAANGHSPLQQTTCSIFSCSMVAQVVCTARCELVHRAHRQSQQNSWPQPPALRGHSMYLQPPRFSIAMPHCRRWAGGSRGAECRRCKAIPEQLWRALDERQADSPCVRCLFGSRQDAEVG